MELQKTSTDTSLLNESSRINPHDSTSKPSLDSALVSFDTLKVSDTAATKSHTLKKNPEFRGFEGKPLAVDDKSNWPLLVLITVLSLIAYLRVNYYRRFGQLLSALVDYQLSSQLVREENILTQRVSLFLTVIHWAAVSLLIVTFSENVFSLFHLDYSVEIIYLVLVLLIGLVYGFKAQILRFFGLLLGCKKETEHYIFTIYLFNMASGLLLIPLVASTRFLPDSATRFIVIVSVGILATAYIARLLRGLMIGSTKKGVRFIHIVLYFCTLEILPLLVFGKLLLVLTA